MDQSQVNPNFFIRSFFVVAFHYVILFLFLLLGMLVISWLAFPDVFALWTGDADEFEKAWESKSELLWPLGLCLGLVGFNIALALLVGVQLAWWAPHPKAAHGVFLAIICIVSYLQIALTQDNVPKLLIMALLITTPTCVVFGSRWGEKIIRNTKTEDENATGVEK